MSSSCSRFAAVAAMAVLPLAFAGTANAEDWDTLAQCESSGNWSANTGNGFYGGLQFTPSTWDAYGGSQYAGSAHNATREQQIAVAEQVLAAQGSGAWPGCSSKTDWESGSGSEKAVSDVSASTRAETSSSEESSSTTVSASANTHVVSNGDTLSGIAASAGVSVDALVSANADSISDPALIYPGNTVQIPK